MVPTRKPAVASHGSRLNHAAAANAPRVHTLVALHAVEGGVPFSMPVCRARIRIFPSLPGLQCAAKMPSAICTKLFHVRLQREPSESWLSDQHLQLMYFNTASVGLRMALKHQAPYAIHHDGGDSNKKSVAQQQRSAPRCQRSSHLCTIALQACRARQGSNLRALDRRHAARAAANQHESYDMMCCCERCLR